jgi:hypothetical protein
MGGVFITGTDTGVGKTWIGTALELSAIPLFLELRNWPEHARAGFIGSNEHKVGEPNFTCIRHERGFQYVGPLQIAALYTMHIRGPHREMSSILPVEQRSENRRAVKARQAQPVDNAVF